MPHNGSLAEAVLLGSSAVMRGVREMIATLAAFDWTVRIEGPSGTGKTVAARLLHDLSRRTRAPFVLCSLALLPDSAELSELFGHRRGAFTGAVEDRMGKVEEAHTGTLFLEELGTASLEAQKRLLQLLDTRTFTRMGENRSRTVDVRFVCATNEDLEQLVAQGRFRADLYYRLGVLVVRMPALADHPEDIPELATYLVHRLSAEAHSSPGALSRRDLDRLMAFSWPGNVRQLIQVLEYFVVFHELPDLISPRVTTRGWRHLVDETLKRHGGRKAAAAAELGVSRQALYAELERRRSSLHGGTVN